MTGLVLLALIVLIGPLAIRYGTNSRVDDPRNGWPSAR
jgi:hypothetical protein